MEFITLDIQISSTDISAFILHGEKYIAFLLAHSLSKIYLDNVTV